MEKDSHFENRFGNGRPLFRKMLRRCAKRRSPGAGSRGSGGRVGRGRLRPGGRGPHHGLDLQPLHQHGFQILQVLLQRWLLQQLGELVADRGQPVVEQGDVGLLALQAPALIAELQLDRKSVV